MGAQKIEVCPNCGDPRLGGYKDRSWCMNTDCAYTWLSFERKESAKDWIRRVYWRGFLRPLYTAFFRIFFAVRRLRNGSAKKRNSQVGWDPRLTDEQIKWLDDLEERGGVW